MAAIPRKLKKDAIVEALLEVRFTCLDLPDVVVGKLASHKLWNGWAGQRLGIADIPAPIRQHDPNLQYQPVLELRSKEGSRVVKFGERVFSHHIVPPYPGWSEWEPELAAALEVLFGTLDGFAATRFGFRYINAVSPAHLITDLDKLSLTVTVAGAPLRSPLNLNYQREHDRDHLAIVRIVSKELVVNPSPPDLTAIIDIDVFTPDDFRSGDVKEARAWLGAAHVQLKEEFFRLFPEELLKEIVEEEAP